MEGKINFQLSSCVYWILWFLATYDACWYLVFGMWYLVFGISSDFIGYNFLSLLIIFKVQHAWLGLYWVLFSFFDHIIQSSKFPPLKA